MTTITRKDSPTESTTTPGPPPPVNPLDQHHNQDPATGTTTEPSPPAEEPAKPVDPRRAALLRFGISITVLNLIGHIFLGFEQPPIAPILAVITAYLTAFIMERVDAWADNRTPEYSGGKDNVLYFLLPAHIAALACSMLLYAPSTQFYLFATVVAVASKYLFRIHIRGRKRHYLNPSNFGIAATLFLFPAVGFTPPYMFTNNVDTPIDWLLPAGVLMAGTMLNAKLTRRMPLILAWVGGYIAQAAVRDLLFDDPFWATTGMMTGVAFVLFTNYMITDPGTTPMSTKGQVAFGLTAAASYSILVCAQVPFAIFYALIITCILRGIQLYLTKHLRSPKEARA